MAKYRTQKFSPKFESALSIGAMISAPLVAAAKANSMMLKEQTKFIMDFCFEKKSSRERQIFGLNQKVRVRGRFLFSKKSSRQF